MGLLDFFKQKENVLEASSLTQEDLKSRNFEGRIVTVRGNVSMQKIIMENYPGFDFQDCKVRIGVTDICNAISAFAKQFNRSEFNGEITVKGKMEILNPQKPFYSILLERKSDIRFKYK